MSFKTRQAYTGIETVNFVRDNLPPVRFKTRQAYTGIENDKITADNLKRNIDQLCSELHQDNTVEALVSGAIHIAPKIANPMLKRAELVQEILDPQTRQRFELLTQALQLGQKLHPDNILTRLKHLVFFIFLASILVSTLITISVHEDIRPNLLAFAGLCLMEFLRRRYLEPH